VFPEKLFPQNPDPRAQGRVSGTDPSAPGRSTKPDGRGPEGCLPQKLFPRIRTLEPQEEFWGPTPSDPDRSWARAPQSRLEGEGCSRNFFSPESEPSSPRKSFGDRPPPTRAAPGRARLRAVWRERGVPEKLFPQDPKPRAPGRVWVTDPLRSRPLHQPDGRGPEGCLPPKLFSQNPRPRAAGRVWVTDPLRPGPFLGARASEPSGGRGVFPKNFFPRIRSLEPQEEFRGPTPSHPDRSWARAPQSRLDGEGSSRKTFSPESEPLEAQEEFGGPTPPVPTAPPTRREGTRGVSSPKTFFPESPTLEPQE
jgi:hypothetical protein